MTDYASAETRFTVVQGHRLAYRLFGRGVGAGPQSLPPADGPRILLMNQHFRGTMDHWDPLLVNTICGRRPVLLFESLGIGRSEGEVPPTYQGWAAVATELLAALKVDAVDVFGFSMGGYTAQLIAIENPKFVKALVLAGTGPSSGDGLTRASGQAFQILRSADGEEAFHDALIRSFFLDSKDGRQHGEEFIRRMYSGRQRDRIGCVDLAGSKAQSVALKRWHDTSLVDENSYDRLHLLRMPVLIANGQDDYLIPTPNSFLLFDRIGAANPNVHIHIYPGGHGFLNQNAVVFAAEVNAFLDCITGEGEKSKL